MTVETIPEPADAAIGEAPGISIQSQGKTWRLARLGLARFVTDLRDEVYEDLALHSEVQMKHIRQAAWAALTANYKMDADQSIRVVDGFDEEELIEVVLRCLLPHRSEPKERDYSSWIRSSLLANGLEMAKIPTQDLPHVLAQLVATGRAMAAEDFTAAGQHAAIRRELFEGL